MMTRAVVRMLRPSGHLVSVAASGEEAVDKLSEQPFDVVVSDMGMGAGMNGWELADEVKRRWPSVRFLLATGWGAAIDPCRGAGQGRRSGAGQTVPARGPAQRSGKNRQGGLIRTSRTKSQLFGP